MRLPLRALCAAVGFLPLALLASWAWAPARLLALPGIDAALAGGLPVAVPATASARLALLAAGGVLLLLPTLRAQRASAALLGGAVASLWTLLPLLVPALLEEQIAPLLPALTWSAVLLAVLLATLLGNRLPASALPMAGLLLLLGVGLSVRCAALVLVYGNPPLYVLHAAARAPGDGCAMLLLANHFASLGGAEEARPRYAAARELLAERLSPAQLGQLDCLAAKADPRACRAAASMVN
jgi:hypothetical protein